MSERRRAGASPAHDGSAKRRKRARTPPCLDFRGDATPEKGELATGPAHAITWMTAPCTPEQDAALRASLRELATLGGRNPAEVEARGATRSAIRPVSPPR